MAKKNVDFNTYVERDLSKSSIDWSTISKTLTDDLTKIQEEKVKRKTAIDDNTIEATNTLQTLEEYDNQDLGTLALGMSNQSAKFLSVQADLQKRGLITATELAQGKQRVLADWKQFSNISKQWNTDYKAYVERLDSGEASSLEEWLNTQNVAFGNLENMTGYVNPETGRLSLVEVDPETGLPSDNPGKHVSMNTINNRFKTQYDSVDTTELVKGKVDALGVMLQETLGPNQDIRGEEGWGTKKDDIGFQEQMRNQVKSLLTDSNIAVISTSPAIGAKPSYEKKDILGEDDTSNVLMKIVNGRPVLDRDAINFKAVSQKVEDQLYGETMLQLDQKYTVEKGFELSTSTSEMKAFADMNNAEQKINIENRKVDLQEKIAAVNESLTNQKITSAQAADQIAELNYKLNRDKFNTNDKLADAQIDNIYANIDLNRDKLDLAELTGDRNYDIALMNETYKSKLLAEKEEEGIIPFTYPDGNKMSEFNGIEQTGNDFIKEEYGTGIYMSDVYDTPAKLTKLSTNVGKYVKGMLDPNVYNELAENGGFDVKVNKEKESGKNRTQAAAGLTITIGGVDYPYPPQAATTFDINAAMKADPNLSREEAVKALDQASGFTEYGGDGFKAEGKGIMMRAGKEIPAADFFGYINKHILNKATTLAIALQEPPGEPEENYIDKITNKGTGTDADAILAE
jgi:hypothetical protein